MKQSNRLQRGFAGLVVGTAIVASSAAADADADMDDGQWHDDFVVDGRVRR